MLEALRKRTGSFVVKLLMSILALSFAFWGIGDMFTAPRDPTVAEVGDASITASQLQREFTRNLEYWRRVTGSPIDADQARDFGVLDQALEALVTRAMLRQEVSAIGIGAPDKLVADMIRANDSFRDLAGNFDRAIYRSVLRQNQMSEEQFETGIRDDFARSQLMDSLASGLVTPSIAIDTIQRFRGEKRTATIALVTPNQVPEAPTPDESAINTFYGENEHRFMAPEYRTVTLVSLRPLDLLDEIEIADDVVLEDYEYRIDTYTTPHMRDVDRLVFGDGELAGAAFERLMAGADFYAVGRDLGGQGDTDMKLGMITRADLPSEEIADVVFGLGVGQVGQPIETGFGWRIFRVNGDVPGAITPFEDAADEIRQELKIAAASDAVFDLKNRFEDERGAGASIGEAASALGIEVQIIGPLDRNGLDRAGTASEALPAIPEFIAETFNAVRDEETFILESVANVFYALRVDDVIEAKLRPLADVRDQAIAAWQGQWREGQSKLMAEEISSRVGAGESLDEVAESIGAEFIQTPAFARDGRDLGTSVGAVLIESIFSLEPGQVTQATATGAGPYVVAVVGEVLPWYADSDRAADANLRDQLDRGAREDIAVAYDSALRRKYGVSVNQPLIDSLF